MNNSIDISIIIVTRNATRFVIDCIQSIENQFKNNNYSWELIIVDGESTDNTVAVIKKYLSTKSYSYSILNNHKKILASGWNIGIQQAKGLYVMRPDAHSILQENYIDIGLKFLKKHPTISVIGGKLITKGKGFLGSIIKEALSSKVGVGNSSFRTATKSSYSDTAVYGIYKKEIFETVGLFNESLIRHQDNDLHRRIKEKKGIFYTNIDMKATYFCRDTISSLSKQMFLNGFYFSQFLSLKSFRTLSLRHMAPLLFYIFILSSLTTSLYFNLSFITLLSLLIYGGYLLTLILNSIFIVLTKKNIKYILTCPIILIMHISYAYGTFYGITKKLSQF